jgi:hypothetical protein
MQLNEEEFTLEFIQTLDRIIEVMADSSEIEPQKFFNMVCVLENLQYFGPVLYGAMQKTDKEA